MGRINKTAMEGCSNILKSGVLSLAALSAMWARPAAAVPTDGQVTRAVNLFAGAAIRDGAAVGIGVAVLRVGHAPEFFSYGVDDLETGAGFSEDTRFQIASMTKIFTTNLVAQASLAGTMPLGRTLASYAPLFGGLPAASQEVTLQELGNFTAGFPSTPPVCNSSDDPPIGCLSAPRPTVAQYGAAEFAEYFHFNPPTMPTPARYFYSDISTGLLGLLLGADLRRPLGNSALVGWTNLLSDELLNPLQLTETALSVPKSVTDVAKGYQLPVTTLAVQSCASPSGCPIASVDLLSVAGPFKRVPTVDIVGGGGSGAKANAILSEDGTLSRISVSKAGRDYFAPPQISTTVQTPNPAAGRALIRHGHVVGVALGGGGDGYPTGIGIPVGFSGGRSPSGQDAKGLGYAEGGRLKYVVITNAGSGYFAPLHLQVEGAAESPIKNNVPIWAAAGGLKSSLKDMIALAQAALSPYYAGQIPTPAVIRNAFTVAETPTVCLDPTCPENSLLGGLAWETDPTAPYTIFKDGGLPGFSSQVQILPTLGTALVVFLNSRQVPNASTKAATGGLTDVEDGETTVGLTGPFLASQIANKLYFDGQDLPYKRQPQR